MPININIVTQPNRYFTFLYMFIYIADAQFSNCVKPSHLPMGRYITKPFDTGWLKLDSGVEAASNCLINNRFSLFL